MSGQTLYTELPTGGDRVYLDQSIGQVTGLRYSHTYPGGSNDASWNLFADEHSTHRALAPGRRVTVLTGLAPSWLGTLQAPQRGFPFQFTATGVGTDGQNFMALPASGDTDTDLQQITVGAQARGLRWTIPPGTTLPAEGTVEAPSSRTLDDVFQEVGDRGGYYFQVGTDLSVRALPAPTVPTFELRTTETPGGASLGAFATAIMVTYTNTSGATVNVFVRNAAAETTYGVREFPLDVTTLGEMTPAQATGFGSQYLAKVSTQPGLLGQYTLNNGDLRVMGGGACDLGTVTAGFLARVYVATPDQLYQINPAAVPTVLVGGTDYDCDSDTLTVTPVDSAAGELRLIPDQLRAARLALIQTPVRAVATARAFTPVHPQAAAVLPTAVRRL